MSEKANRAMRVSIVLFLMSCAAIAGLAPHAAAAEPASSALPDTMAQRMLACAGCHGRQGEGVRSSEYYPRIAGKPAAYLYSQLVSFREGRRKYPQMVYLMRHQSDAYLREIADYYAKLQPAYPPPAPAASKDAMALGATLVRRGDRRRGIPACTACHGADLAGMQPGIPGIVGLYPDYVNTQLGAWQRGLRRAAEPDCMAKVVAKLNGAEIAAISAWLAAQPVTSKAPAAPDPRQKLPLHCGTEPDADAATLAGAQAPKSVPAMSRGEYLARAGDCIACHTARGGVPFVGGLALRTPFGTLYTPNITPDADTGIGKWTADDFWNAMHNGRSRDGTPLYPAFPYTSYTRVTRADGDEIFRYLKSLAPVRRGNTPHQLAFPYNQRKLLYGWRALWFDEGVYEDRADESAEWNRGAYLVQGLGHCDACHTSRNFLGAAVKGKELAGGVVPQQDWYAPSLTSNREAGLGQWEIDDIVALLATGISRRGAVFGPMAQVVHDSLQHLTAADARAMAVYLKSIAGGGAPADPAQVRLTASQAQAAHASGAKIYKEHCESCHLASGAGRPPAYPPLANNQAIDMAFAINPIRMVLFGGFPPSTAGNPRPYGMPPFAYLLSNDEVAAVVTYVRQSWGNRGGAVAPAEVAKHRSVPTD